MILNRHQALFYRKIHPSCMPFFKMKILTGESQIQLMVCQMYSRNLDYIACKLLVLQNIKGERLTNIAKRSLNHA